jgi:hypothetical protein
VRIGEVTALELKVARRPELTIRVVDADQIDHAPPVTVVCAAGEVAGTTDAAEVAWHAPVPPDEYTVTVHAENGAVLHTERISVSSQDVLRIVHVD